MPIEINCAQCKKLLKIKPSKVKRQINCFCSIKCKAEYQKGLDPWNKGLKLPSLSKEHKRKISIGTKKTLKDPAIRKKISLANKNKIVSIETRKKISISNSGKNNSMHGMTGNKNPNWKGGVSHWRKQFYQEEKYKKWHASVLKRDNYECKICGQKKTEKGILHVHHIKSFAKYPKLRTEINNGIVLCKKCHEFVHSRKYQIGTIKSIEKISKKINMIDIEVEDNNNFFANDILVHNSATAFRDDGKTPILNSILGKVIYKVDTQDLIKQGYLVKPEILFYKNYECTQYKTYQEDYENNIVNNVARNVQVTQFCEAHGRKKILILTKQVEHGAELCKRIEGSHYIYGGLDKDVREMYMEHFKNNLFKVLIMTQSIGAEGIDIPNLDVIINAAANKGDVKSIQTLGRVLRIFKGKSKAVYIDFLDSGKHTYKHSCLRMKVFEDQGHTVEIR